MRKLRVFESVSLDGYFTDANGDLGWAHASPDDRQWNEFVSGNASGGGTLLFGRKTYEMMVSFWPTPAAAQQMPEVAAGMNAMTKLVFSRTLERVSWQHTQLCKGDLLDEVRQLKRGDGSDIVILGSGSLVAQLAPARLIDGYQLVVVPVALGGGRTLFAGIKEPLGLKLTDTRSFDNGNVVLSYQPA
jgi:dihydrofolate reductase